jgi:hypothetical protein
VTADVKRPVTLTADKTNVTPSRSVEVIAPVEDEIVELIVVEMAVEYEYMLVLGFKLCNSSVWKNNLKHIFIEPQFKFIYNAC